MDIEKPTIKTTKENPTENLDDKWYERFKELASFEDYEYLTGDKETRNLHKGLFLAGFIENPILDYPELERLDFEEKEKKLIALKNEIVNQESNPIVRQLYRWRINEKIAELRMLKEAGKGNDNKFLKYSCFIYGKPEKEIYEYTIWQVKNLIDKKLFDADLETQKAAQRLNKELFKSLAENETTIKPEDFNLPKIKSTKGEAEYQAEEIKHAFEEALERYKISGWEVVVDNTGRFSSINTSQEQKNVNIPQTSKLKETELQALIEHEIGTHVVRREKGERTKLKLLGLGLDRYLKGEEGIATYREQEVEGANNFSGFDGHFAISLATGIDGRKRNFREVFNILKDYYFIQSKKSKEEALKSSVNSAWNRCIRTFRGTTCKTRGACLTRDIVYREGNIGVWNVIKNNSDEARRFTVGKYDPANPRHIWILNQLGIADEDLDFLEK